MEDLMATGEGVAYVYQASWLVQGNVALSKENASRELHVSPTSRHLLTLDPDGLLEVVDKRHALGRLSLVGFTGAKSIVDSGEQLAAEVDAIRRERRARTGGSPILFSEIRGEFRLFGPMSLRKGRGGLWFTLDEIDLRALRNRHEDELNAMKVAVALEGEAPARLIPLSSGIHFTMSDGRTVFPLQFEISGEAYSSTALDESGVARISSRYGAIRANADLDSVERLFCAMCDVKGDKLKEFLFGWTAVEILIMKLFKIYDLSKLEALNKNVQPRLRLELERRAATLPARNFKVVDKFIVVTMVLLHDAPGEGTYESYRKFCEMKELRDHIFHGQAFSIQDLPVNEVAGILHRYFVAHLAARDPTSASIAAAN